MKFYLKNSVYLFDIILKYMSKKEITLIQGMSKRFYNKIVPRILQNNQVNLGDYQNQYISAVINDHLYRMFVSTAINSKSDPVWEKNAICWK